MSENTYTRQNDATLMTWQILPGDGLSKTCILIATMDGSEIQTISLHLATSAAEAGSPSWE